MRKGPLPIDQLPPKHRVGSVGRQPLRFFQFTHNRSVEAGLIFVIPRQSRMDLRQRQMRMLKVNFLRTPAVGKLIQNYLRDFHLRSGDPRHTLSVNFNLSSEHCSHGYTLSPSISGLEHLPGENDSSSDRFPTHFWRYPVTCNRPLFANRPAPAQTRRI